MKRCCAALLGNDLIEFHTERYALNFLGCVAELVPEAEIDADTLAVHYDGRRIDVAIFPISIDVERYEQLASTPESTALVERLRKRYASNGMRLGLGVDRVDYTKGIPERLRALCELWERHPEMLGTFTFLLVATPSRSELPAYRALEEEMLATVIEINERFKTPTWHPDRAHSRERERGHARGRVSRG